MNELIAPALLVAIGIAIMQMFKYADPNNVFKRFYPLTSFVLGLLLGFLFHLTLVLMLTSALAIAGFYDGWTFTVLGRGQDAKPAEPIAPAALNNP